MDASERDTIPIRVLVLAVGFSVDELARLRECGGNVGAQVAACTEEDARASATALLPHAIIVPAAVRRSHPGEIDAIAAETCARVLELPTDDTSESRLASLLEELALAAVS
jgi:hypothetical protein